MKVGDAKQLIKNIAEKHVKVPVMLVGSMGIGKSWIVKQVAAELNYHLIDLRLAQQEPGDLIGLPRKDAETHKTVWLKPEWWPDVNGAGILFLDELNRAPVDVRQAVFQLINEWKMHTHVLPDNWTIVAAGNPDVGSYQVEQLDPAMIRRFVMLRVNADTDEWIKWAYSAGVDDLIIRFIGTNRNLLAKEEEVELNTIYTPDSYRMLDILMKANVIPKDATFEVIAGLIGTSAATAFIKFMDKEYKKPVGGKEILEHYDKVREKVLSQRNDEMYVTQQELIAILNSDKKLSKEEFQNFSKFLIETNPETKAAVLSKTPTYLFSKLSTLPELVDDMIKICKEVGK
jgi:hypothetical protein